MESPSQRGYLIPLNIVVSARKEGITLDKLQEMVRLSARCTHERGNRRYKDVVFMVVGKRVMAYTVVGPDIGLENQQRPLFPPEKFYNCNTCKDTGRVQVFDECEQCHGIGCNYCDQGLVSNSIPCPMCEQRKRFDNRLPLR